MLKRIGAHASKKFQFGNIRERLFDDSVFSLRFFGVAAISLILPSIASSQESEEPASLADARLDRAPYVSTRAAGIGGAFSTLADGIHAPYYNPAGIGGLNWGKKRAPFVRQFNLPYVGGGFNTNTRDFKTEFDNSGGQDDKALGESITKAHAGNRQYGRGSALMSFGLSRFLFVHSEDVQLAALNPQQFDGTPLSTDTDAVIRAKHRSLSSTGAGLSMANDDTSFALGVFASNDTMTYLDTNFSYQEIVNNELRSDAISNAQSSYSGERIHLGLRWEMAKKLKPTLAIVRRDLGGSKFKKSQDNTDNPNNLIIEEDLTLGFSINPKLSKSQYLTVALEASDLSDRNKSIRKKVKGGVEWSIGGFASESNFGLRAGFGEAGPSAGASFNLGLLQLEYAMSTEDIGLENTRVLEQRHFAIFSVNVRAE